MKSFSLLALAVGFAAATSGGDDDHGNGYHNPKPETSAWPEHDDDMHEPKTKEHEKPPETIWQEVPKPTTIWEHKTEPTTIWEEKVKPTTIWEQKIESTIVYQDVPVPTTVWNVNTISTTITSLTTEPAVTVYITSTTVETDIVPTTVTATETTASPNCDFCKIDIYATPLVFPTSYITTTVYESTLDVYKTVYDDLNSTAYSTNTIFAPTACIETPVSTWERFGVVLTSPTTYLAYTTFSRGYLELRPTVYGCGELVSVPLDFGPDATAFEELIIATTVIPSTPTPAPSQLLAWMDTIPTIVAQLSGIPAVSCDTPNISSVATTEAQVTATVATTVSGAKLRLQTAQHVLGSAASSASATSTAA